MNKINTHTHTDTHRHTHRLLMNKLSSCNTLTNYLENLYQHIATSQ